MRYVSFLIICFFLIGCEEPKKETAPSSFSSTASPGNGVVTITWLNSSGSNSYAIKRGTTAGSYDSVLSSSATSPYIDSGLNNGTTYFYLVTATNSSGTTESNEISATPVAPPSSFSITSATATDGQAVITWNNAIGATSYILKRGTASGNHSNTITNVGTSPYTDTGLTNGTTYYYMVTAVNAGGSTNAASEVSATPIASPSSFTFASISPGNTQVVIAWNNSTGATSYTLKRGTASGSYPSTISTNATSPYTDTGLTNGTTYYYMVTAVNAGGSTNASSEVSTTPVAPPSAFSILSITAGSKSASVTWQTSTWATSYILKRGTVSGNYSTTVATLSTNSYTDSNLTNDTTYYYMVTAVNSSGSTNANSESSVTPVCALGTNWTTLDNFSGDFASAHGESIKLDSLGNIYSVGSYKVSSSPYRAAWLVRKSTDSGVTWSNIDSFQYHANTGNQISKDIAIDSNDRIYVVGYGEDSTGKEHWLVRKSTDFGNTWSTVDDFQLSTNKNSEALSITIESGNIYVAGLGTKSNNTYSTVVRKSTDYGASWSTIQEYQYATGYNSTPSKIDVNSFSGLLSISGTFKDSSGKGFFSTRVTSNSGNSWQNSDLYQKTSGEDGYSYKTIFESATKWISIGTATNSSGTSFLTVRKSSDSGTSWTTVLDENYNGILYDSLIAHDGYVYSVGYKYVAPYGEWKVRKSSTDFSSNSEIDTFTVNNGDAIAKNITRDSNKNLLVIGYSTSQSGNKFIVRKLICE